MPSQVKSRQLKKLFEKYQAKKAEVGDVQEQFQLEREGMLDDYRILTQQVGVGGWVCGCVGVGVGVGVDVDVGVGVSVGLQTDGFS